MARPKKAGSSKQGTTKRNQENSARRCGLCGGTRNLTRTECCGNWICDDEDQYVMFSFARNSCHRNHRRYTLCGYHYTEGHAGDWQDCPQCRKDIEPEMYVYYGTNEYNFEKLPNPPEFEPTRCIKCQRIIRLGYDCHTQTHEGRLCEKCSGDILRAARGPRKGSD